MTLNLLLVLLFLVQIKSLNKPLFNTCHTVSALLPFVVQRSTRSHTLVMLCAMVIGVRECGVFLGFARLFLRFLLNVKQENIKKIAQHSQEKQNFILVILHPRTDHLCSLSSLNSLFKRPALCLSTRTSLTLKVRTILC